MSKKPRSKGSLLALLSVAAIAAAFAIPAVSFADSGVPPAGCDFFQTAKDGTVTNLCSTPLTSSTFAGADGNLLVTPTDWGTTDWENVSGLNVGIDNTSGKGDNSFGQGTKEDDPNVTVVSGSIPPNKSDLTRFYQASETISGQTFMYLAWERNNVLGSANMDFEINQIETSNLGSPGAHTLQRSPGDLLVTFDFTNGGGEPVLGLNTWLTSASVPVVPGFSTNVCLSSNSFPCWGDHTALNGSIAIGAVNSDTVTDPIQPLSANACPATSCPALTFGETAINLTAAGVFGTGTCKTFASTFLKSRASSSFPAEVKDFVAPVPTTITNCGEVTIIKHTDPRGVDQNFSYDSDVSGTIAADPTSTACPTGSGAFTLNDNGNTSGDSTGNTENCFNVPIGSYTVTEGAEPNGFVLESLSGTGTTGAGASCTQHAAGSPQADIVVTSGSHVICTYTNQQQLGAIKITKTSIKGTALAGATFSIKSGGTPITGSPFTTDSNGEICVDHLPFGDYSVQETAAPTGYSIDDTTAHTVTVSVNSTCGDGNEATFSATDTPLTDITATATSEAVGGTESTISCVDSSSADVGNSPQGPSGSVEVDANGLAPGTYTCTIVIDP